MRSLYSFAACVALSCVLSQKAFSLEDAPRSLALVPPLGLLAVTLDENRDYRLDRAEIEAGLSREFLRMAGTADAAIGALDWEGWAREVMGTNDVMPGFAALDPDLDGSVAQADFIERYSYALFRLDKDQNGIIDRSELVRTVNRPQSARRGDRRPQRRANHYLVEISPPADAHSIHDPS